ncbi:StAR-related lipid transfer protein 3 (Fragment) [Geodia barretti]
MLEFTSSNDSWKFERTADGVTFRSRTWQGKKIWKAEKEMELGAGQLWNILYPGNEMPLWNPQCTLNESVYKVDEETDVVYSVTSAVGPVSSRDFVSLRQILRRDDFFISASVATTFSQKPAQPGKVRGENGPCGYKVVHIDDNRCLYIWVLNTDLKGWLPQSIIDQTFCGVITGTFKKLRQFIEQRRSEGRL